jgi:hypothetical protein
MNSIYLECICFLVIIINTVVYIVHFILVIHRLKSIINDEGLINVKLLKKQAAS